MSKFRETEYTPKNLGSFDQEWLCHKKSQEWWYATGYFYDEDNKLYSYQYTMVRAHFFGVKAYIIMVALTDFQTNKHYYTQKTTFSEKDITITEKSLGFAKNAKIVRGENAMTMALKNDDFSLDLILDYGKGPIWHCNNGWLYMGLQEMKETTLYFSWTNMPTMGTLVLNGKQHQIKGKSWFDKQGGTYSFLNPKCQWEWFSLRFFDDEEVMLQSFPQHNNGDGTYISKDAQVRRLNQYTVTPKKFTTANGYKFSCEWEVNLPAVKEEKYLIKPLSDGQLNLAYFELLAGVYNSSGKQVGMCFVELLPGVYNEKINPFQLFKKVN
jgi:predicted secreted hydrolase